MQLSAELRARVRCAQLYNDIRYIVRHKVWCLLPTGALEFFALYTLGFRGEESRHLVCWCDMVVVSVVGG